MQPAHSFGRIVKGKANAFIHIDLFLVLSMLSVSRLYLRMFFFTAQHYA